MHEPPTILDDRGTARPLYAFPRTRNGVPPGSPLTTDEQIEIESALGVPQDMATPYERVLRPQLKMAIGAVVLGIWAYVGFATGSAAIHVAIGALLASIVVERFTLGREERPYRLARRLSSAGVFAALCYALLGSPVQGNAWWSLAWVGLFLGFVAVEFVLRELMRLGDPRRNLATVKRVMLGRFRCPSCASPIGGGDASSDGCALCATCGAAWRLSSDPSLKPTACEACGYSLDGLVVHPDGTTRCPECGRLSAVWSPLSPAQTGVRCWTCRRSLVGLELVNGDRVKCPDCGTWRSGLTAADVQGAGDAS